jgi:TolB protein
MRRVLLIGAVLAVVASNAGATAPGRDGRIAYMRKDAADHWQIWTGSARLTGARKLTRGPADSGWPVWSPDGSRLAFDSTRTDPSPNDKNHINDVFVMHSDGTHVMKVTDSHGSSGDAAWSPDGKWIAFDADRGDAPTKQGIYMIRGDGSRLRRVTVLPRGDASDSAPRFAPDGKHIVFTRYRGHDPSEKAALFTVRIDGTGLRQLTPFSLHAGDADWSPDGKTIVFEAYPNPDAFGDVYVVAAGGGRPRNLTRNPVGEAGSADPVWSPDGLKILFLDNRNVNGVGRTGLATISPNGTGRAFISSANVEGHQPDWESIR